jgi:hypothetical protein
MNSQDFGHALRSKSAPVPITPYDFTSPLPRSPGGNPISERIRLSYRIFLGWTFEAENDWPLIGCLITFAQPGSALVPIAREH